MQHHKPPTSRRRAPQKGVKAHDPWSNEELAAEVAAEDARAFDDDQEDRPKDIVTTDVLPASQFRLERFAELNIGLISDYADYRVQGWNAERAFTRVFGTDYADLWLQGKIEALEHNLVYRKIFAAKFGALNFKDLYGPKVAVYELLSLINHPFTKDTARLAAIKELNVLYGITTVDETGRTRAGKALSEFYTDTAQQAAGASGRHPEPGSDAAEAFVADSDRDK